MGCSNQTAGTQCPRMPGCHHPGAPLPFVERPAAAQSCLVTVCCIERPAGEGHSRTSTPRWCWRASRSDEQQGNHAYKREIPQNISGTSQRDNLA